MLEEPLATEEATMSAIQASEIVTALWIAAVGIPISILIASQVVARAIKYKESHKE